MTSDDAITVSTTPVDQLTFEQAQAELESIVERLEDQRTGLDEALALWERGEALHALCQSKLDVAQARIEKLKVSPDEVAAVTAPDTRDDFVPARDVSSPSASVEDDPMQNVPVESVPALDRSAGADSEAAPWHDQAMF